MSQVLYVLGLESKSGRLELNQRPLGPEPNSDASEPFTGQGFTPTLPAACTAACTSEAENANAGTADGGRRQGEGTDEGDRLDKLAAALLTLSPADRERLAAMLTGH